MVFRSHCDMTFIFKKSLRMRQDGHYLSLTKEVIELSIAAGEYDSLLKTAIKSVDDPMHRHKFSFGVLENLISHASAEQIEQIVLPKLLPFLNKENDFSNMHIYSAITVSFQKMSPEYLETILPQVFKFLDQDRSCENSEDMLLICIEKMNANIIEKIIVPALFKLYEASNVDTLIKDSIAEKLLPKCIEKLNADALEKAVIPALFKSPHKISYSIDKKTLSCIDKMSLDALKRSLQSELESRFTQLELSNNDKNRGYHILDRNIAFVPYLALISRFNKDDNDKISERLLKHLSLNFDVKLADSILIFLKSLRSKNIYVNEVFFQEVQQIVVKENENNFQKHYYSSLYTAHITQSQVENFFEQTNLDSEIKIDSRTLKKSYIDPLVSFVDLSTEVYPMTLRMKSLRFLQKHMDSEDVIFTLQKIIKKWNFLDVEFRKMLIQFAHHAIKSIESICYTEELEHKAFENKFRAGGRFTENDFGNKSAGNINKYHYCKLLETCTSMMTEEELATAIFPQIRIILKSVDNINVVFLDSIKNCLEQIFLRIKNEDIIREYFNFIFTLYFNNGKCGELLPVLTDKVDLRTLSVAYRKILYGDNDDYRTLNNHAYLLALLSKRIPSDANKSHHDEVKITQITKKHGESCSMM